MFKKYSSIENSYRAKHIMKALEWYPELKDCKYSIREKIDGSNLQIFFEPGKEYKVGKRSKFLEDGENFYEVWDVLNKYQAELSQIQYFVDQNNFTVRLFGEIYGQGVQKRVNYGDSKYYAIFDVEINGVMQTQASFEVFCADLGIDHLLVPLLGYANNLQEALDFNVDFDSRVLNNKDNPAEGVVIKPYEKEFNMGNDQRFVLKKKSDRFNDKMKSKNTAKLAEEASHIIQAKSVFQGYINENRVLDIFSKHGEIQDMKDFGKYIKLTIDDAVEDFIKDYDISQFDKKELKKIYSSGGKYAAGILKRYV